MVEQSEETPGGGTLPLGTSGIDVKAAAFFDLDHTLLTVNSSFQFGKYLYQNNFFSFFQMIIMAGCYAQHKAGWISMENLHQKIFQQLFIGKTKELFVAQAKRFVKEYINRISYQPAVEELKTAQAKGTYVAILSSAPDFLVTLFAKELGVEHWDATIYEIDGQGRFSCISNFLCGQKKSLYTQQYITKLGIKPAATSVYTDSILDLPFLQSAGCKIGVRPDKKLLALCKQNQWRVI